MPWPVTVGNIPSMWTAGEIEEFESSIIRCHCCSERLPENHGVEVDDEIAGKVLVCRDCAHEWREEQREEVTR